MMRRPYCYEPACTQPPTDYIRTRQNAIWLCESHHQFWRQILGL